MSGVRSGVARFLLNPIKNWSGPIGNSHWPPAGSPGTDRLPLYVWYVRRRSRDVLPKVARRRLGRFRLAYLPGGVTAGRVGRELLLSFEIGGENSGRLAARGIVLT